MLLLPILLSFLSRSVLSILPLSPVCPASCQALLHLFFHPVLPHHMPSLCPQSCYLVLTPSRSPPSIPTSGPLEPQLVLIKRGRGKTVHWGLKRDVNSPLANRAPPFCPQLVCLQGLGASRNMGEERKVGCGEDQRDHKGRKNLSRRKYRSGPEVPKGKHARRAGTA